jgi:hypothetical protein
VRSAVARTAVGLSAPIGRGSLFIHLVLRSVVRWSSDHARFRARRVVPPPVTDGPLVRWGWENDR